MNRLRLITTGFFLFGILIGNLVAQSCLPNGITFTNQQEIDDFAINFPTCTIIEGNVLIEGPSGSLSDIQNLNGLNNIETILGNFAVRKISSNDTSLEGMINLNSVQGNFSLTDLDFSGPLLGFENLQEINGKLVLDTLTFTSYASLNSLQTINDGLNFIYINVNDNLNWLDNVQEFNGSIFLDNISSITDLSVFSDFSPEGIIYFGGIDGLASIPEMPSLNVDDIDEVTMLFYTTPITNCSPTWLCQYFLTGKPINWFMTGGGACSLTDAQLGCSFNRIAGNVYQDLNENCSLDMGEEGFESAIIEAIGPQSYYANTDALGNYEIAAEPGTYTVNVIPPSTYWNSCVVDEVVTFTGFGDSTIVDFPLQSVIYCPEFSIDVSNGFLRSCRSNKYTITYCNLGTTVATGTYIELDIGTGNLSHSSGNSLLQFDVGNVEPGDCHSFNVYLFLDCDAEVGETYCVEAQVYANELCTNLSSNYTGANLRLQADCINDEVLFSITNIGTENMSVDLNYIVIEDHIIMLSGNEDPLGINETTNLPLMATGATYRLNVEQIPGHPNPQNPTVAIEGCSDDVANEISLGFLTMFPEYEEGDYVSIDCSEVRGSFDPNDKRAFPKGYADQHFIEANIDIDYKIRFQNVGNDTAFKVVIVDTLSPHMDMTSIRAGASSHPYQMELEGQNIIRFIFDNIMIPDSNVNEPASHGFIKFKVSQNANNPDGTLLENFADIYFDFNDPIRTDTAWHTIGSDFIPISDNDQDGSYTYNDCDDSNPLVNENATETPYNGIDDDCNEMTLDDDLDQDGFVNAEDCDDNNPLVNNGPEVPYNGIDDDCNEATLDDDLDQDGFVNTEDCDDNNPLVNENATEMPYNGIDDDCDEATLDDDLDQDGFVNAEDCDDNNPLVNNGPEVPYNGIDDDCNEMTLDDDLDQDGYANAEDCDDNNALVNIGEEVPYNGLDDDCDEATLDDDLDQDGFANADDCDDNDPLVNSSVVEVPYNGLDDDCDETTLDDDLDQDGFGIAEDCDDNNNLVNTDATEIPYNGLDDDCNEMTLDDDLDQDGYGIVEDCDDENPAINTTAEEIPNNGIDEDCDGEDLIIISTENLLTIQPQIFPNPTTGMVNVLLPVLAKAELEVIDYTGKRMSKMTFEQEAVVDLSDLPKGVYILLIKTADMHWVERAVKM